MSIIKNKNEQTPLTEHLKRPWKFRSQVGIGTYMGRV
jgi:hypothetical protein